MTEIEVQETQPPYPHQSIVACDFDNTLVKWDALDAYHEYPLPGAREALSELKQAGKTIAIFTSRLDPTWLLQSGNDYETQYNYVKETLRRLNIPYDFITGSKVPALFYADDRNIEYNGDWSQTITVWRTGKSTSDLAWFAGVFEGEGWIYQRPRYPNQIEIGIEMTDEDTIKRLNAIFPGSVSTRQREDNRRTYTWRRTARASVIEVVEAISPWLSQRRLAKAQEVSCNPIKVTETTAIPATTLAGIGGPAAPVVVG